MHFEFEYPLAFILLSLIVCIYRCPLSVKQRIFPHLQLFNKHSSWINLQRLLYSIILALLVSALASPITYTSKSSNHRKGRDLVFVIDTSGSMDESGYSQEKKQASKFSILQEIIKKFTAKRFDDNVGVVVYGSFAFSSVPITYDMKALAYMLDFLEVGMAGNSTAIGDGIHSALSLLKKSHAKNRVIILLTDGHQNSGVYTIENGVNLAKEMGVKIYTIGIESSNDYDKYLLNAIAEDTHAKSFNAKDEQTLQEVYNTLNTLEPSAIRSQHFLNKQMLYIYPLALAILLLLYLLSKRRI